MACALVIPKEPVRPEISWIPSLDVFTDRVERLQALYPNRRTTLPRGWPTEVNTERTWAGADFKSEDDFVLHFSAEDVAEIEAGLAHFKALPGYHSQDDVNQTTFPLPNLGSRLVEASKTIHEGRGFVVMRGLEPTKYSSLDNMLLYLGVTSYIAEKRGMQDYDGRMVLHIKSVREDVEKHGAMPNSPYVNRAQPFHTDLCDVLSMYALGVAASGGESFLASTAKIYNDLARNRPDIIELLTKDDWVFDQFWNGEYHTRPLLYNFPHHGPGFQFSRRPLTGANFSPHHAAVPAMTELQAEALDAVYFLAKQHAVTIRLQRGDMLVFNNFAMLHARNAFQDDDAAGQKRHMLRLWLRNEERMWETPRQLESISRDCYGDHYLREKAVWDVESSPPELRIRHRRASCS